MGRVNKMVAGLLLVSTFGLTSIPLVAGNEFSPYVDANGNISFAEGFRTSMALLINRHCGPGCPAIVITAGAPIFS